LGVASAFFLPATLREVYGSEYLSRLRKIMDSPLRIGPDMPTKYKPQLDQVGFDWTNDMELIRQSLIARKDLISAPVGFSGEDADLRLFIEDVCGALCWAAAIQMDAGFKAANKIIATLQAVEKDSSSINAGNVEPEALGMIASQYQLAGETPGTYGFDVYQDDCAQHELDLLQVSRAASRAVILMQTEVTKGPPKKLTIKLLGEKIRDLFLRYNDVATRHSIASDGGVAQFEAGPYFEFCETVIAALNEFFARLPSSYAAKPISAAQVARTRRIAPDRALNT
jgi:hypothetical protein